MKRDEIFWGILSFALTCFFSFAVYLLSGSEAFIIALLFDVLVFLGFWELAMKGGNYRIGFVVVFLVLALLAVGLPFGTFESVRISSDSYIDVSWGAVALQVQNVGLSTISIQAITVGNITYTTLSFVGEKSGLPLGRGQNSMVVVYYHTSGDLAFHVSPPVNVTTEVIRRSFWNWLFVSDAYVTPVTYLAGQKYPVIIRTQFREHYFEVEAKRTAPENLEILDAYGLIDANQDIGLFFKLNNTYAWDYQYENPPVQICSLQVGNMTFTFHPSVSVYASGPDDGEFEREYYFFFKANGEREHFLPYRWDGLIDVKPELDPTSFRLFESYEVTFWTLSNNTYTNTMTFSPAPHSI
jgi:hypothetical protein